MEQKGRTTAGSTACRSPLSKREATAYHDDGAQRVTDLGRLAAAVRDLASEQAVLAGLVRQLVEREAPQRWMRTGAICKLAGIHRATLYAWQRSGLVGRGEDAIGEVVWDREEVLRVRACQRRTAKR